MQKKVEKKVPAWVLELRILRDKLAHRDAHIQRMERVIQYLKTSRSNKYLRSSRVKVYANSTARYGQTNNDPFADFRRPAPLPVYKFPIGRTVYKEKGDYFVNGAVVAHFHSLRSGHPRYVVEDVNGVLYVLRENQLTDKLPA